MPEKSGSAGLLSLSCHLGAYDPSRLAQASRALTRAGVDLDFVSFDWSSGLGARSSFAPQPARETATPRTPGLCPAVALDGAAQAARYCLQTATPRVLVRRARSDNASNGPPTATTIGRVVDQAQHLLQVTIDASPEYAWRPPTAELRGLRSAVNAGASAIVADPCFDPESYFRLRDELEAVSVEVPVVPSLLPLRGLAQAQRSAAAFGIALPNWMARRLSEHAREPASERALAEDLASSLGLRLLEGGAPGLHIVAGQDDLAPTLAIWANLGGFVARDAAALTHSPAMAPAIGPSCPPAKPVRHRPRRKRLPVPLRA